MRFRFDFIYRAGLLVLFLTACRAVWASAQETNSTIATNAPAATTNAPPFVPFFHFVLPSHALSFGLDQFPFLCNNTLLDQPLWKYLSFLIYIVLAFYAAKFLDFVINSWLKKFAAKTKTVYDDLILDLLRGPVKVVVFVILLNIGLGVFKWPGRAQIYFAHGLLVIVACSMTYVALKIVDLFLGIWREKVVSPQDKIFAEQLFPIFSKTAKIAIVIIAILLTADNLHIEIKTLLAGLSVGGLALGLAAQDTIANMFGAVSILLDKPFHIGDRIKILAVDGTVESIGLRSTRVRSLDGHLVTIPNKTMGNEIITNVTRRPTIKTEMNFGLTYDLPVEKVKRATLILEEIFQSNPKTGDLMVSFNKFGDSALNIGVVHVWNGTDAKQHSKEMQELNLKIKERFDAEKIEMAFPTQTVFVKNEKPN
ncbi:MAG TPA: mechanosensitive ion channel family protein [Candidatus Sulfotelmatobacter sp.]|jgi:MscS family membrane protein|nr:mechanosensitive ion channel family protein [Candidatus Sulfotelmatobacter sp.]